MVLKPSGSDEIYAKGVKQLAEGIVEPLAVIVESSWKLGDVPNN